MNFLKDSIFLGKILSNDYFSWKVTEGVIKIEKLTIFTFHLAKIHLDYSISIIFLKQSISWLGIPLIATILTQMWTWRAILFWKIGISSRQNFNPYVDDEDGEVTAWDFLLVLFGPIDNFWALTIFWISKKYFRSTLLACCMHLWLKCSFFCEVS